MSHQWPNPVLVRIWEHQEKIGCLIYHAGGENKIPHTKRRQLQPCSGKRVNWRWSSWSDDRVVTWSASKIVNLGHWVYFIHLKLFTSTEGVVGLHLLWVTVPKVFIHPKPAPDVSQFAKPRIFFNGLRSFFFFLTSWPSLRPFPNILIPFLRIWTPLSPLGGSVNSMGVQGRF